MTDSESLVVDADNKSNSSLLEDSDSSLRDSSCNSTAPLIGFDPHEIDDKENVGKFLYLEGIEYFMWCTYNVHCYASFALLDLFPKIELSIQRDFARAVLREDNSRVRFLADGTWGIRKVIGAVARDLGAHDQWHELNAYNIHDTSSCFRFTEIFLQQVICHLARMSGLQFVLLRNIWNNLIMIVMV